MESDNLWPILLNISQDDWVNIKSNFNDLFTQVSKIGNRIQKNISSLNSYIEKNESKIKSFLEKIDSKTLLNGAYQLYISNVHNGLIEHGFYIGLSTWTIKDTSDISKLIKENNHDRIIEYLLNYLYKDENISWFAEKWDKNIFFKPRMRFIKRGLDAHKEKDFIASIPILLPHIEAILADFFVSNSLLSDLKDKFQGNDALKILTIDSISTEVDKIFFRRFINKMGIYDFKKSGNYLNRGKILHGVSLDYDKEEWSAQVVYLLDFICDLTIKPYDLIKDPNRKKILLAIKQKEIANKANSTDGENSMAD